MRFNKSCQNNFFSWKKKQNGHPLFHPLSPSFSGIGREKEIFIKSQYEMLKLSI
jgi:hypothetical protein